MTNSDLLDYYLKTASTHATIIVAVVFGLFSILNLLRSVGTSLFFSLFKIQFASFNIQSLIMPTLIVLYVCLVGFGSYEIDRWRWYGSKAKDLAKKIEAEEYGWKKQYWIKTVNKLFKRIIVVFILFMSGALIAVLLSM